MGSTQQFCLKWNNHQSNMLSIFDQLLSSEHFVDVTLACDGLSVRAHKMVLSACSPFFQSLFIQNPCEHPIVILKDIRFVDLKALVQFMYRGEVNVSQDQLPTLLKAAEALKIKGLAEVTNESGSQKSGVPSVAPGLVGGSLGPTLGGGHSHNGHLPKAEQLQVAQLAQQQQPSVQAAAAVAAAVASANPSPLAQSLAPAAAAAQNALVAAMQQNALKQAQFAAAQAAQERQNATSQSLSAAASMASHESNSNASTPLRQTDSPMSQQNRKRRRKSASSEKGSGDEGSGVDSGAEDNLDETRGASDDESAGEEAEFEPSKLLEQSMTEVRQGAGHQDNNSSSSDNLTKEDIKPAISFGAGAPDALAGLNTQDPTAVLAFAAAAQAAQGASGGTGDSVAGPSQPTHVAIKKELVTADGTEQGLMLNANTIKKEIVDEVEDGNVDEFITRYNTYLSSMQSAKGKLDLGGMNRGPAGQVPTDNQCPICKKSYSTKHSMRRHMLMHKPYNRRFECVICQKMFNWPGNLRTHLQTIHQMRPEDFEFKNYKFPEPEEIIMEAEAAGGNQ